MLVIALVVGVIMVTTAVIPLVSDYSDAKSFTNTGLYYITNPDEEMTVEYLGDSAWEINGEPLVYTNAGATNILIFDSIFVRNNGQVRGTTYQTWTSAELTIGDGTVTGTATVSGTPTSINWTYTDSYVATNDSSAEYIMKAGTSSSYINEDSSVIGMGLTSVKDPDGANQPIPFYVTVEGLEATVSTTPAYESSISISDIQVNYSEVGGYRDLYSFDSVTFKATWGTNVTNVTYNIVIVPHEVTAEKDNPDQYKAIVSVLPILAIVGLIAVAAGAMIIKGKR